MIIYVDIDETICDYPIKRDTSKPGDYSTARPLTKHIDKINKLYDEGNEIVYYTARGALTGIDYYDLTKQQLNDWGAKHHKLSVGEKPYYDLLICDKTKRIEEI